MSDKNDLSTTLSSSKNEPESEFSDRLRIIKGSESESSFAQRCKIPLSSMRKYLQGSMPGVDKAVQIANRTGFSVSWLVAGEGLPRPSFALVGEPDPTPLDLDALELAIIVLEEALQKNNFKMWPAEKATIIASSYDIIKLFPDQESARIRLHQILGGTLSKQRQEE